MPVDDVKFDKIKFSNLQREHVIHPVIDFHNGKLYKGVVLPTQVKRRYKNIPYFITSDRSLIRMDNKRAMKQEGILTRNISNDMFNRWRLESIESFLNGQYQVVALQLYQRIREILYFYLDFENDVFFDVLSLWIIGTHVYPIFNAFPILWLHGEKGSGKTKTLMLLSYLVHNGILSSNVTSSSMFRLIHQHRPTILIDEAETLKSKNYTQSVNILLSGYKKGSESYRVQGFGNDMLPTSYETYCPKAIAAINHISNDALRDRAIKIECIRSNNEDKMNKDVYSNESIRKLHDDLHVFALEYAGLISTTYSTIEIACDVQGRKRELLLPLITLIDVCQTSDEIKQKLPNLLFSKDCGYIFDELIADALFGYVKHSGYYRNRDIYKQFVDLTINMKVDDEYNWVKKSHIGHFMKKNLLYTHKKNTSGKGISYWIQRKSLMKSLENMKRN